MKNPKIATVEKPAPKVKTEQSVAAVLTETTKPKKPDSAPKSSNKPKTVAPKPVPKANAEQPILSAEGAKPKKATTSHKSQKKPKAAPPKAVVPVSETSTPEGASLPPGNIWPNWVVNLLVSFGIKTK